MKSHAYSTDLFAFRSFNGTELYPSIYAKADQLCFGLVKNHAMVDGNKRLGAHVMLVFLILISAVSIFLVCERLCQS